MKRAIVALAFVLATSAVSFANESPMENAVPRDSAILKSLGIGKRVYQSCCRVCTRGKACGNSCIAADKICHQPPGCACNG